MGFVLFIVKALLCLLGNWHNKKRIDFQLPPIGRTAQIASLISAGIFKGMIAAREHLVLP